MFRPGSIFETCDDLLLTGDAVHIDIKRAKRFRAGDCHGRQRMLLKTK